MRRRKKCSAATHRKRTLCSNSGSDPFQRIFQSVTLITQLVQIRSFCAELPLPRFRLQHCHKLRLCVEQKIRKEWNPSFTEKRYLSYCFVQKLAPCHIEYDNINGLPLERIKADSATTGIFTTAFHEDMRRVLISRQHVFDDYLSRILPAAKKHSNVVPGSFTSSSNTTYSVLSVDAPPTDSKSLHLSLSYYNDDDTRWQRLKKTVFLDSDIDGANRVLSMLRHLQSLNAATEETYQIVMEAFLNRGRLRWHSQRWHSQRWHSQQLPPESKNSPTLCAADQVEELLLELQDQINAVNVSLTTYILVLKGYAMCSTPRGDRNYAKRAKLLFERIKDRFDPNNEMDTKHKIIAVMHLCHVFAWQQANLQSSECAEASQTWLEQLQTMTNDTSLILRAHHWVVEAWSKSGSDGSAIKAYQLLQTAKLLSDALTQQCHGNALIFGELSQLANAEMYSNAILAWSKSNDPLAAVRAQQLLDEMLEKYEAGSFPPGSEPPLIAFNGAIIAWGHMDRPDKAEEVLWLMERFRTKTMKLIPNAVSFNTVIHSYMRSRDKQYALEKTIALVQYMEEHSDIQPEITPNCFTYNTLLKCWIQSTRETELAEQAERMLTKMEKLWEKGDKSLEPTNRIFNMVINAYAKSSHRDASKKAVDLLRRMNAVCDRGDSFYERCRPDIISYTSAIECASKSSDTNSPQLAERLLEEVTCMYEITKDPALMPNLRTYTMAILTLANHNGNPLRARLLLTRLLAQYESTKHPDLAPNTFPYNYVLNCAANSLGDKSEAFQVAAQTYQEMRKSSIAKPNTYTYAFWIKCCNNLLVEGSDLKKKCISYAFQECKAEGLVSNEVLVRLFQGTQASLVIELLGMSKSANSISASTSFSKPRQTYRNLKIEDLDHSWSRNVPRSPRR